MSSILPLKKVVTGGQTGTDRALLDVALELGLPCGGWCPKGRLAEDGIIADRYPLVETATEAVEERTELNARDSDGTVILIFGPPTGGTLFTIECAEKYARPFFEVDMDAGFYADQIVSLEKWRRANDIQVLNVAGPRESLRPGRIYLKSVDFLKCYFTTYQSIQ